MKKIKLQPNLQERVKEENHVFRHTITSMSKISLFKITLCLFYLLSLVSENSFSNSFTYKNLTTAEGLSHNTINCFAQDNQGYIWIGTTNGINRFDGYNFKKYYFSPNDSLSLKGKQVNDLQVDTKGCLWVSTETGLYYFNPKYESFHKIKISGNKDYYAKRICIDPNENVWAIIKDNYLVKIKKESHQIDELLQIDSLLNDTTKNNYYSIEYHDGFLWFNGSNGVFRFDYNHKKIDNVFTENTYSLNIQNIKKGKQHELLVVVGNKGIYKIDTQTLKYTLTSKNKFNFNISDILYTTDVEYNMYGDLIVGGFPGLFVIKKNEKIEHFNQSHPFSNEFNKLICNCIYSDSFGNIWIGTMYNGVFMINKESNAFSQLVLRARGLNGIHIKEVQELNDKLYVNNFYGAFSIDKITNETTVITDIPILSINKYTEESILLASSTDIFEYTIKTKSLKKLISVSSLYCTYTDSRGIIWISHWGNGIEGIDLKSFKRYKININNSNENKNTVYTMLEDTDGSLWLGTFGSGLVHIQNPLSNTYKKTIYTLKDSETSFGYDVVLSLYNDKNGYLWVGTNGSGLRRFNKTSKQFDVFNSTNGLRADVVVAINGDSKGNIWLTSSVLSRYDIKTNSFTHFDLSDGVSSKYYTTTSTKDSIFLYFGDDKGILAFNPNTVKKHNDISKPVLTGVKLYGIPIDTRQKYENHIPFPVSIGHADKIELPYNLNSISFEFASINPLNSNYIEYSYMLEGSENKWIPLGTGNHSVTYSGLRPGNYTFKVKASVMKGVWSEAKTLPVTITPPWWQALWLKILTTVSILLSSFLIIRHRFKNIHLQNILLEQKIQQRTQKLKDANEIMKQNNLVIEMKNKQLNEALKSKDKLISILAHDFKNPLQGILGLSQLLQKDSVRNNSIKLDKYINVIVQSAKSLADQMLKVLDWVKSQDQNMEAKPQEVNLEILIDDVISLVNISATKKDITIAIDTNFKCNAYVDPHMINTVFRNVLSNAIKFTPKGGTIHISIDEQEQYLETTFTDEGIGIDDETIQSLFHSNESLKSSYGTNNEKGTGLGLQLCKTYIDKNSGTFSIQRGTEKGSIFKVILPKGKTIATNQLSDQTDDQDNETDELQRKNGSILIIEDEISVMNTISEIFGTEYNLIEASDGKNGLELAKQVIPDIIISDINLPEISGIEICTLLKNEQLTSHIPVLLITSHVEKKLKDIAFQSGANDFIEKPFNPFYLKKKIESLLEYRTKLIENFKNNSENKLPDDFNDVLIKKVIVFINQNISNQNLNTNMIADEIGLSRSQMWRVFKHKTGNSLSDYIREIKMQKAATMLMSGRYRIGEVSDFVGFSDSRYFSRIFIKKFGITPTEYSKQFADKNTNT